MGAPDGRAVAPTWCAISSLALAHRLDHVVIAGRGVDPGRAPKRVLKAADVAVGMARGGPCNRPVEWYAEIINEVPSELIGWKSLPGSDVDCAGSVRFTDAPGGRGTEVRVELQYNPPAGMVGAYLARLFGREPEQEIEADLGRLKQYLEGGEVATTAGQPQGGSKAQRVAAETLEEAIA